MHNLIVSKRKIFGGTLSVPDTTLSVVELRGVAPLSSKTSVLIVNKLSEMPSIYLAFQEKAA